MADIQKDIEDLRDITREAHETIKDLRLLVRDAGAVIDRMTLVKDDLLEVSSAVFDQRMGDRVSEGLEAYKETLDKQIELATESVYARFDTLSNILLGKATDVDIEELIKTGKIVVTTAKAAD